MSFKQFLSILFLFCFLPSLAQDSDYQKFRKLSCPEKWWTITHPFVAKKALKITTEARSITKKVLNDTILKGTGNGLQVDAFRHTYWMARLAQEINWRKARRLGITHEKGNKRDYKKHRYEDGAIPDKISSDMDLFNNSVGIKIGKENRKISQEELKEIVIQVILQGKCKVIKMDEKGNFLDGNYQIILLENLKGKWENEKCLVNSDL